MAEYVVEFGKDGQPVEPDGRLDAAAFHRNHQAIWAVLQKFLAGKAGDVVEAGSGTGQHVVHFARHAPDITSTSSISKASRRGRRIPGLPMSAHRCGSICPIRCGVRRCTTAAAPENCWRCSAPM